MQKVWRRDCWCRVPVPNCSRARRPTPLVSASFMTNIVYDNSSIPSSSMPSGIASPSAGCGCLVHSCKLVRVELPVTSIHHKQLLTAIDASPLLLKVVNCPALKFRYALDSSLLQAAVKALLQEFPIIGGRLRKLTRSELSRHLTSHPHLKAASYCIQLPVAAVAGAKGVDANGGIAPSVVAVSMLLAEAHSSNTTAELELNAALAAGFSMTGRQLELPAWYQPLDVTSLFKGTEPLLKLQLTHTADGGCVLAASMPHLLVDSHSSTLLLRRLSELYKQAAAAAAAADNNDAAAVIRPPQAPRAVPPQAWSKDVLLPSLPAAAGARASHSTTSSEAPRAPAAVASGAPAAAAARLAYQDPAVMKALGLTLQTVERPSLGLTLKWLAAAVSDGLAASRLFPRPASLVSLLLHVPAEDVEQVQALAAAGQANNVSLNDTLSALVWVTFCQLRQRALPGSSSCQSNSTTSSPASGGGTGAVGSTANGQDNNSTTSTGSAGSILRRMMTRLNSNSSHKSSSGSSIAAQAAPVSRSSGVLGLALDLRHNCSDLKLRQLSADYLGNAAWCIHLPAQQQPGSDSSSCSGAGSSSDQGCDDTMTAYVSALRAAAASVRAAVQSFRAVADCGSTVLELVQDQQAAPATVMVHNLCRLAVQVDAFVTSWAFSVRAIDFGTDQQANPVIEYSAVVRPTPPWQAAVLPQLPKQQQPAQAVVTGPAAAANGAAGCRSSAGDVQLLLTVPASAVSALRSSPVLRQLVPGAVFGNC